MMSSKMITKKRIIKYWYNNQLKKSRKFKKIHKIKIKIKILRKLLETSKSMTQQCLSETHIYKINQKGNIQIQIFLIL